MVYTCEVCVRGICLWLGYIVVYWGSRHIALGRLSWVLYRTKTMAKPSTMASTSPLARKQKPSISGRVCCVLRTSGSEHSIKQYWNWKGTWHCSPLKGTNYIFGGSRGKKEWKKLLRDSIVPGYLYDIFRI